MIGLNTFTQKYFKLKKKFFYPSKIILLNLKLKKRN